MADLLALDFDADMRMENHYSIPSRRRRRRILRLIIPPTQTTTKTLVSPCSIQKLRGAPKIDAPLMSNPQAWEAKEACNGGSIALHSKTSLPLPQAPTLLRSDSRGISKAKHSKATTKQQLPLTLGNCRDSALYVARLRYDATVPLSRPALVFVWARSAPSRRQSSGDGRHVRSSNTAAWCRSYRPGGHRGACGAGARALEHWIIIRQLWRGKRLGNGRKMRYL